MMKIQPVLFFVCTLLACGCFSGQNPTVNVSGKVTLDGEPVQEASVVFTSPRTAAGFRANLNAKGEFAVDIKDVKLGETYKVCIRGRQPEEGEKVKIDAAGDPFIPLPEVPRKYVDWTTSGLEATIDGTENQTFHFKLKSK